MLDSNTALRNRSVNRVRAALASLERIDDIESWTAAAEQAATTLTALIKRHGRKRSPMGDMLYQRTMAAIKAQKRWKSQ